VSPRRNLFRFRRTNEATDQSAGLCLISLLSPNTARTGGAARRARDDSGRMLSKIGSKVLQKNVL
jgi:hypothetical protein